MAKASCTHEVVVVVGGLVNESLMPKLVSLKRESA